MAPKTKTKEKTQVKLIVSAPYMDKYWELDRQIKELEAQKEELRESVLAHLRKESHPLYSFSISKKSTKIDPFKIYEWIKGAQLVNEKGEPLTAEKLESLATHSLAPEALDLLYLDKYINEEDIPEDCYIVSGGKETIRPKAKKD